MHPVLRLIALIIAIGTGALAAVTIGPALAVGPVGGLYPGQIRGMLFTAIMAAVTIGLLWVALRPDRRGPRPGQGSQSDE